MSLSARSQVIRANISDEAKRELLEHYDREDAKIDRSWRLTQVAIALIAVLIIVGMMALGLSMMALGLSQYPASARYAAEGNSEAQAKGSGE